MREKIKNILSNSYTKQGEFDEDKALNELCVLLDVSGCLSISKGIEICQRWERHLTDNEEDIGHIPTQEEVVKEALK